MDEFDPERDTPRRERRAWGLHVFLLVSGVVAVLGVPVLLALALAVGIFGSDSPGGAGGAGDGLLFAFLILLGGAVVTFLVQAILVGLGLVAAQATISTAILEVWRRRAPEQPQGSRRILAAHGLTLLGGVAIVALVGVGLVARDEVRRLMPKAAEPVKVTLVGEDGALVLVDLEVEKPTSVHFSVKCGYWEAHSYRAELPAGSVRVSATPMVGPTSLRCPDDALEVSGNVGGERLWGPRLGYPLPIVREPAPPPLPPTELVAEGCPAALLLDAFVALPVGACRALLSGAPETVTVPFEVNGRQVHVDLDAPLGTPAERCVAGLVRVATASASCEEAVWPGRATWVLAP